MIFCNLRLLLPLEFGTLTLELIHSLNNWVLIRVLISLSTSKLSRSVAALTALVASHFANAGDASCGDSPLESSSQCVDVGSWHLGVALGAGIRLTPLVDGDNYPLIVVPDIAYYGERWYWDNSEAGYQWHHNDNWSAEAFLRINSEKSLFSFWHTGNLLSNPIDTVTAVTEGDQTQDPPAGGEAIVGDTPADSGQHFTIGVNQEVSINDIADRNWALDAGIRIHYLQDNSEWSITILSDVSGVHNGQQLNLEYSRLHHVGNWQIQPTLSLLWKSSELTDYYYGLDARDDLSESNFYSGKSGWQPSLKVVVTKPINEQWNWLVMSSYQHLHKGMRRSPIVRKNSIITAFAGVTYRF